MKVGAPHDVQGRLIVCSNHAKMLAFAVEAMSRARKDVGEPSGDVLDGLSSTLEDLAAEIDATEQEYVRQDNAETAHQDGPR